jgi:hypothetical protein
MEQALRSPSLPPAILNRLLNLVEFMELRDRQLPIGWYPTGPSIDHSYDL